MYSHYRRGNDDERDRKEGSCARPKNTRQSPRNQDQSILPQIAPQMTRQLFCMIVNGQGKLADKSHSIYLPPTCTSTMCPESQIPDAECRFAPSLSFHRFTGCEFKHLCFSRHHGYRCFPFLWSMWFTVYHLYIRKRLKIASNQNFVGPI